MPTVAALRVALLERTVHPSRLAEGLVTADLLPEARLTVSTPLKVLLLMDKTLEVPVFLVVCIPTGLE